MSQINFDFILSGNTIQVLGIIFDLALPLSAFPLSSFFFLFYFWVSVQLVERNFNSVQFSSDLGGDIKNISMILLWHF